MVLAEMMIFAEMSIAEMVLAEMMIFAEMSVCWNGFSRNDDFCWNVYLLK